MKKILLLGIIFYSLFTQANTELGRPLMYERAVKKALSSVAKPHKCHEMGLKEEKGEVSITTKVNTDYFVGDISCQYRCQNTKQSKTAHLQKEFRPLQLSLYEGDGSSSDKIIWRSLGMTIKIWGKENCYQKARKACQDKVETFSLIEVKSGNWKLKEKLDCSQNKIIYSPFDEGFKLNNSGLTQYRPIKDALFSTPLSMTPKPSNKLEEFFVGKNQEQLFELADQKKCKKKIKVHSCFGDCVWEANTGTAHWSETLATKEYLGTDDFSLCADQLEKKLKDKNYSKAVRAFKCEKFVWEYYRKTERTGSSCAALRIESSCENF